MFFIILLLSSSCFIIANAQQPPTLNIPPTNAFAHVKEGSVTINAKNFDDTLDLSNLNTTTLNNQVIDIYDTKIADYTTPTSCYSSSASTSIQKDTSNAVGQGNVGTELSTSVTIANNPNRLLLVGVSAFNAGAVATFANVTYNGILLQHLSNADAFQAKVAGSGDRTGIFYLINPPTGMHTLLLTYSSSSGGSMGWLSVFNVDQTVGVQTGTNNNGNGGNHIIVITPTYQNSWIFSHTSGSTSGEAGNDTVDWNIIPANSAIGQHLATPRIGAANTMSFGSVANEWAISGAEILKSSACANAIDNSVNTEWRSISATNPWIVVDMGSAQILSAIAIFPDLTKTNSTQLLYQTSSDNATWTTKRTNNISLLANGTWNFERWDLDNQTMRWIRVFDNSAGSHRMAIVELKVLEPTTTTLLLRHGHKFINATDGTITLNQ